MICNTRHAYGWAAIFLHWSVALLFVGEFLLGLAMVRITSQRAAFELIQFHKSIGFLLLLLVLVRLGWRAVNPRPELPSGLLPGEKNAARAMHWLLYLATIFVPVSGWVLVSSSVLDIPSMPFGLFVVPNLPVGMDEATEATWSLLHEIAAWGATGLAAIHGAAALHHHFWRKDEVLLRMMRARTSSPGADRE